MDILISSNLERLIYRIAGEDADKNAALMKALVTEGRYEITPQMREQLSDFYGNYASEEETGEAIHDLYEKTGYVMDTHTAVAKSVYEKYRAPDGRHSYKDRHRFHSQPLQVYRQCHEGHRSLLRGDR